MKEAFDNLVGKILNLPKEKLADFYESDGTTLKADAVDTLATLDAQRIKQLKDANKEELTRMHDTGYSKGKGESLSKYENDLRETFGVDNKELKGIDLIKEVIAKNAKVDMDEEKIKLHPRFLELERKLENDYMPKAEYDKVKAEYEEFKTTIEKTKVTSVVKAEAIKVFRSLKPVLSKDPVRATNQESDFANKLTSYEFELQDDGNHIIKVNGKRLENANGHAVSFADFVKSEASKYYDFEQQGEKGNSGNANDGGGSSSNVTLPSTEAEYVDMLANEPDPKKQVALMNAWKEKHK